MNKINRINLNEMLDSQRLTVANLQKGIYPRMISLQESGNSRLARRIKSGKTNKKIATKN